MAENELKDQNILLVLEHGRLPLKAVAEIGKDGTIETVEAAAQNADRFLRFDRNNPEELAELMSDFNRNGNNPNDFRLFQVRYGSFEKETEGLHELLSGPRDIETKKMLSSYHQAIEYENIPHHGQFGVGERMIDNRLQLILGKEFPFPNGVGHMIACKGIAVKMAVTVGAGDNHLQRSGVHPDGGGH